MTVETILLILVILAGFYMAWSIGANDVSNAMGTSVGSSALTLRQAVLIAAILEFSGAFFFGSHVSATIQNKIIDPAAFSSMPLLLACGMLASLLGAGIWMQVATYYGWPVSTTHSIIGAVVGFGIAIGGIEAIYWENVFFIAFSWVLSPLLGAVIAFMVFSLLKQWIFYSASPVRVAKQFAPLLIFLVSFVLLLLVFHNGIRQFPMQMPLYQALPAAAALAGILAILSYWYCERLLPTAELHEPVQSLVDAHAEYAGVEKIFGKLQVLTACMMAFVHGANDVANAIGPLSAAITLIHYHSIAMVGPIPPWTLALGGVGIVFGLATWGWRVIETIGKKITHLTPTRGFAAEFSVALVVAAASRLGMPISTTHTLVGAVIGVGFARGLGSLDISTARNILISWVITIPIGAFFSVTTYLLLKAILRL
jgi:phosphate/sulfate permease